MVGWISKEHLRGDDVRPSTTSTCRKNEYDAVHEYGKFFVFTENCFFERRQQQTSGRTDGQVTTSYISMEPLFSGRLER